MGTHQTFIFTRHAYSCNNLNKGLLKKAQYNDKDPSITFWGLINTYKQGLINNFFANNEVNVSILLRTWITTTLLYIHRCDKLSLYIKPYLKEKHLKVPVISKIDTGNAPDTFKQQIIKYIRFLKTILFIINGLRLKDNITGKSINIIYNHYNVQIRINKTGSISLKVKKNRINITATFINKDIKTITMKKIDIEYIKYLNSLQKNINVKHKKKLLLHQKLNYYFDYEKDASYLSNLKYYEKFKNLKKYINWYYNNVVNNNDKDNDNINKIYNVCHNHVMSEFLKVIGINKDIIKLNKHANSWTFEIKCKLINNNNSSKIQISEIKIYSGIPYSKVNGKEYSVRECETLCYNRNKLINHNLCNKTLKNKIKKVK